MKLAIVAVVAYIASIVAANWAIVTFGFVPVGFGLLAPAGVYFAGVTFTLRDVVHDHGGARTATIAVIIGACLSALISSPQLALASGTAFVVSELADLAVYAPLRRHHWIGAVVASNTVGLVIDSALFLALAFGSLDFLAGQVVGKAWMTVLAVVVITVMRRR